MGKNWTKQELEMAKSVRESGKPVKTQLHHFPGRTQCAIEHQMRKLTEEMGRKKIETVSLVWIMAHLTLSKSPGLTAHAIVIEIGYSYRRVMQVLYDNHASDEKCIYISGWEKHGVNQVPQWTIGNEPDAPRLPIQTREEYRRKERVRLQTKRIKHGAYNPFASAMGIVKIPDAPGGRVYKQDMVIHLHDELEAA